MRRLDFFCWRPAHCSPGCRRGHEVLHQFLNAIEPCAGVKHTRTCRFDALHKPSFARASDFRNLHHVSGSIDRDSRGLVSPF